MNTCNQTILATLVYADIFSYPLSFREIKRYLISKHEFSDYALKNGLKQLIENQAIIKNDSRDRYALGHRQQVFAIRKHRQTLSQKKLRFARYIASILRFLPTIQLIALTGGLAMNNSEWWDDIDFYIVTRPGTLWLTRALLVVILEVLGVRRRPHDIKIHNALCINMIVDSNHLAIPPKERDLYSAHEIVQLKPLFVCGTTYQKFLIENQWIRDFLPNALKRIRNHTLTSKSGYWFFLFPLECISRTIQLQYMRKKRMNEVIRNGYVRFHPLDARSWILAHYYARIDRLKRKSEPKKKVMNGQSQYREFQEVPERAYSV